MASVKDDGVEKALSVTSLVRFRDHLAMLVPHWNAGEAVFRMSVGYVEVLMPTASVDLDGERHVVTMTTGLASTIQEFALYYFSQKAFFADVGNAGAETAPPAAADHIPGLWLLLRTLEGMREVPADAPRMIPVDPGRHVMGLYLSLLMMRFVWFHELAHGLLGHVDYRRHVSGDGACGVEELVSTETAAPSGFLESQSRQCMEFEADSWAPSGCLLIQR